VNVYKLGKNPKRCDRLGRTFRLERYVELPTAPPVVNWVQQAVPYGMLCNDRLSCCLIAAAMHLIMQQRAFAGLSMVVPTDAEVIAAYSAILGYDPSQTDADGNNPTDNGGDWLTVLNYGRQVGITFGGITHKWTAFAEVPLHNPAKQASALWLFGGTADGIMLPASAQGADSWLTPLNLSGDNAPGSWGGHAVDGAANNSSTDMLEPISWGGSIPEQYGFRDAYQDEQWVVFTPEWIEANSTNNSPCGFNADQLLNDLKAL
jgi:hypothetical protein